MADRHTDTIAAVATPAGRGGVGIIRLSGPNAGAIARQLTGRPVPAHRASYRAFLDAGHQVLDRGIVLYFPAPNSFTGEDVLELQGHGGPAVLDRIMAAVLAAGARPARAGEFSERAFINGKLDLAQAEAVADLIAADSHAAAGAAMRSLDGAFSREVDALLDQLVELRVYVEAALDFPDEEIDFLAEGAVADRAVALGESITGLLSRARSGAALQDGFRVVIAGKPNAGKSSLLNRLARRDVAIVTDIPGTTRDVLEQSINLDGLPLQLIDTAGLRRDSQDLIEQEGMRRAHEQFGRAQHLLLVADDREAGPADAAALRSELSLPGDLPTTLLLNKCDLSGHAAGPLRAGDALRLSALTGDGVDQLVMRLHRLAGLEGDMASTLGARRRHVDALQRTARHVSQGVLVLKETGAGELLAQELGDAQQALGEITGRFHSEDLLGAIFSSFCIGK